MTEKFFEANEAWAYPRCRPHDGDAREDIFFYLSNIIYFGSEILNHCGLITHLRSSQTKGITTSCSWSRWLPIRIDCYYYYYYSQFQFTIT